MTETNDPIALFWSRIDKRAPDECWPWLGAVEKPGGTPIFQRAGRIYRAARLMYELEISSIPEKHWVRQRCGHPWCVNPAHLIVIPRHHHPRPVGAVAPNAKLNHAEARAIRAAKGQVPARDLAAQYGVSMRTILRIWGGRSWKDLPQEGKTTQG